MFLSRYPFIAVCIGFAVEKKVSDHTPLPLVYTLPSALTLCAHARVCVLQLEFGVVYSCIEDKMYTARRGKGAFCNGEPLQVSQQRGDTLHHTPALHHPYHHHCLLLFIYFPPHCRVTS